MVTKHITKRRQLAIAERSPMNQTETRGTKQMFRRKLQTFITSSGVASLNLATLHYITATLKAKLKRQQDTNHIKESNSSYYLKEIRINKAVV